MNDAGKTKAHPPERMGLELSREERRGARFG
jgi:hypothetical protein